MQLCAIWLFAIIAVVFCMVQTTSVNPCCSFPCQNNGVCMTTGFSSYSCDCSQTGYYGDNCEHVTLYKRIVKWLKPTPDQLHYLLINYKWFWSFVNAVPFLSNAIMKKVYLLRSDIVDSPPVYEAEHAYATFSIHTNASHFARTLPPVPLNCPTPMGVKGKKELPDVEVLIKKFFTRKTFRPDPLGTSVLFSFFAQHFTHQFFKTDLKAGPGYTWAGNGVDVSHVYGKNTQVELALRSHNDGRLKSQMISGEEYPPYLKDVPGVTMRYPPNMPENMKFAIGHDFFGLFPGLFAYATIWLREHNRVAGILKQAHPEWDDEQLFQTTKLIIIGETIRIVVVDYVQHLSNYHYQLVFNPEVLFGESFQYQNRINVEFNHLYRWHPLMPDNFNITGTVYKMNEFVFHSELVIKHGLTDFVESMSRQQAGRMSHHNHGPMTVNVLRETILHGRELRFQPLNRYRQRFSLTPFKTFEELTGETEMAKELEELYGDIDALEFYVGLLMEKRRTKAMFGSSLIEIGGPFSVKGLLSNPICSPRHWKPSTFGGEVGFNLVKTATLKKLFCENINGPCPLVSFRVPDYVEVEVDSEEDMDYSHEEL
ncbi:prostaglandin G/H synthase 2-like isoform X2 [Gigantopelta aegis]|nr:prostaglandin G/H synthase 2-like isoform X2 [Gigantopelta aegis]XP_041368604.1 prostaglandin G/H synthase 2-like isoform X2 [Gigantopelta aegis]